MKSIDTVQAREQAEEAFKKAYSYRHTDAMTAVLDYLDARIAYCQAALVDSSPETFLATQTKAKTLRDLRYALSADEDKPRTTV